MTMPIYLTDNETLYCGGYSLVGLNNTFYASANSTIVLKADIVDAQGNVQTQLDQVALGYPPVLKMPVVKFVGGINGTPIDEVYFSISLVNGVLTAEGFIANSGDWKLLTTRINQALQSIGANWRVDRPNTTFLV